MAAAKYQTAAAMREFAAAIHRFAACIAAECRSQLYQVRQSSLFPPTLSFSVAPAP
jgi:hypothetical protein